MKAVAFTHSRPITDPDALQDIELPMPVPRHHDLLVEIKAVSVNPIDTKIRQANEPLGEPRVLGFDAAGIVRAIGPEVQNFSVGDEVYYAGVTDRPGTNAEFHLVDDRIVGHKPRTLNFAAAAALPLTALTAWEMLFERFRIPRDQPHGGTLLVVGAGGGVGSMAIQLAAQLTDMTIIATASRPETADWCRSLGAHHIVNHHHDFGAQILQAGLAPPDHILCVAHVKQHFHKLVDLLAPEGAVGIIESNAGELNVSPLIRKSATLHTEYVFTRGMLHTANMAIQHRTLEAIAHLVDNGTLKTTMTENFGLINAGNLMRAHAALESGETVGKIVLEGF
jgi:zinc-binding alcohol dehydrogenase family protein